MKRSEQMIAEARARAEHKEGIRIKVRVPSRLWDKVVEAAKEADEHVERWARLACTHWNKGTREGVPIDMKLLKGTRAESKTVWARVPHGFCMVDFRFALAQSVAYFDKHRPPKPNIEMPTCNFIIEKNEGE